MAEERTILELSGVTISTRRIVIGNQMFPVTGVTSVKLEKEAAGLLKPFLLAIVGTFVALGNAGLGVAIIIGAIAWPFFASQPYLVKLTTAAGEITALSTPKKEDAETILGAISQAITA